MDQVAQLPLHAIESPVPASPQQLQPDEGVQAEPASEADVSATTEAHAARDGEEAEAAAPAEEAAEVTPLNERQRIEEQLSALKRRESELRRALAIADHPALGDAIRELEGRVHAVSRAEDKLAQGLSKSEERRRETLERKLGSLREKQAELEAQIAVVTGELSTLGVERIRGFEQERDTALEQLMLAFSSHGAAIEAAGLVPGTLVPELARFLPAVEALAERYARVQA